MPDYTSFDKLQRIDNQVFDDVFLLWWQKRLNGVAIGSEWHCNRA